MGLGIVVELDGYRLRRGFSRKSVLDRCEHRRLIYSQSERRVTCEDCNRDLEPFTAFMSLVHAYEKMHAAARRQMDAAKKAMEASVISRAAQAVDRVWRGRTMLPCCPHCRRGLAPEDFAGGVKSAVSREMESARRRRDQEDRP